MVKLIGTGKGHMKLGVLYEVHPNLVDRLVSKGFATLETFEEEKEVIIKKKRKNEKII
jgi:exosome complex RNA-binding protein Rrp4